VASSSLRMARRLSVPAKKPDAAGLGASQTIKTAGCTVILLHEDFTFSISADAEGASLRKT